ncbi:MAG: glutamate synthase-related protein [Candidatus Nanoarchaeia archaeon]|nr:glutamate synthase-related protein [Candidatus Nanoarchaeia archaeon]
MVGGSIRSSSDIVKAIALGADACYIATSALMALGCITNIKRRIC